jgi:hypothetical protein
VWNAFIRLYSDGERAFCAIDDALAQAMLLSQLKTYEEPHVLGRLEYYANIAIAASANGNGVLPILRASERADAYVWTQDSWSAAAADVRYRSLFDFEPFSGRWREFRYVEGIVVGAAAPRFSIGQRLLFESDKVRLLDLS